MPLAWSSTVTPYWPMPTSDEKTRLSAVDAVTRCCPEATLRSTRAGVPGSAWSVHIQSMPARDAISMTLPAPRCSVRSKNGTLSEATVASTSVQSGWHGAVEALRTGPVGEPLVRPLAGNSFVEGESQCEVRLTPCRNASARS
jgi:hypothetical protein